MNTNPIDITDLILAAITLIAGIVTRYVVPWIKNRTTQIQYQRIQEVTRIAVEAAEQLCKNGTLKADERKNYVNSILNSHGFTVDYNQLESMIESCVSSLPTTNLDIVRELKQQKKLK